MRPQAGGVLGQPGLVWGTLTELRSDRDESSTEFDEANIFVPRELNFPTLNLTQRTESRGDLPGSISGSFDHSKFSIGNESFVMRKKEGYAELECQFEPGSIAKRRHGRFQEALGFALCQPVWPAALVTHTGGKRSAFLFSPSRLATNFKVSFPPFHFPNQLPDLRAKFFDIVSAYYLKIIHDESSWEHPISSGASLVMEALQSYVTVMILALAVAAEALIRKAFPNIVESVPGLAEDIAKLETVIDSSELSDSFKKRIKGSADAYTSPSGQDRLYSFITKFGLDPKIHDVWKKARNPVAHGTLIDLFSADGAKILEQRNKALYLCHAIVLAYIGYSGPHTRYDVLGWPVTDWKPAT